MVAPAQQDGVRKVGFPARLPGKASTSVRAGIDPKIVPNSSCSRTDDSRHTPKRPCPQPISRHKSASSRSAPAFILLDGDKHPPARRSQPGDGLRQISGSSRQHFLRQGRKVDLPQLRHSLIQTRKAIGKPVVAPPKLRRRTGRSKSNGPPPATPASGCTSASTLIDLAPFHSLSLRLPSYKNNSPMSIFCSIKSSKLSFQILFNHQQNKRYRNLSLQSRDGASGSQPTSINSTQERSPCNQPSGTVAMQPGFRNGTRQPAFRNAHQPYSGTVTRQNGCPAGSA